MVEVIAWKVLTLNVMPVVHAISSECSTSSQTCSSHFDLKASWSSCVFVVSPTMGSGASTGISKVLELASEDEIKAVLAGLPKAERDKLKSALSGKKSAAVPDCKFLQVIAEKVQAQEDAKKAGGGEAGAASGGGAGGAASGGGGGGAGSFGGGKGFGGLDQYKTDMTQEDIEVLKKSCNCDDINKIMEATEKLAAELGGFEAVLKKIETDVGPVIWEKILKEWNKHKIDTMIFQLGTNNWQVEGGGFAPGSGILHEAHHNAYNKMPNTRSYSVWPLPPKLSHEPAPGRTDYRVFKLEHDIPICESVSPVSSYRWHSMSEEDFDKYRKRLADFVYDFMEAAEAEAGAEFNIFIAHHSFLNPLVGNDVIKRRAAAGKTGCKLCVFVHGTALKMYVHERGGANPAEYPLRFLPLMQKEDIFSGTSTAVSRIFAISKQQVDAFKDIFTDFPDDKVTISPNGIDFDTFKCPEPMMTRDQVLGELKTAPYEGEPAAIPAGYDKMVTFVGKFANWKRLDALLQAAAKYEKAFEAKGTKVCTIIAGSGPPEAIKLYQDMALKELGLKHAYFIGPQPQPVLAKLYSVSSVGVFPSKAEPFGLVFVECMACQTPVIGANSGGPKDFVSPEVGMLCPEPGSYEPADCTKLSVDLDKAITQAIDEDWKTNKGPACLALAREKFGVGTQVGNLIKSVQ